MKKIFFQKRKRFKNKKYNFVKMNFECKKIYFFYSKYLKNGQP